MLYDILKAFRIIILNSLADSLTTVFSTLIFRVVFAPDGGCRFDPGREFLSRED